MADRVEFALLLTGLNEFISGTKRASGAVTDVGDKTEETGKKAGKASKAYAAWGAAAGVAAYGAVRFLKGAVSGTEDLAKSTYGLQAATGMDTKTASAWVGVLEERHISTDQFRQSLTKMSRQMYMAQHGSKTAIQGFHDLGISQQLVASGNTEAVLEKTADAMKNMKDPATRAALAQIQMGRAGTALLPILNKGSQGIRDNLEMQEKAHNVLTGKSIKDTLKMVHQQRELNAQYKGIKLQLGLALIPVLLVLANVLIKIVTALGPLLNNSKLLTAVIIALTAAFVAYEIAMVTATIATTIFEATALLPIIGIVLGVTAGLVLLGVAIYEVVHHWGFFKGVLIDVWKWVEGHWPLLLAVLIGPFAIAVVLIVKHFDRIRKVALAVVAAIKHAFTDLVNFVKGIPGKIGGAVKKIPGYGTASKALGFAEHPHFASGGVMPWSGPAVVGEAGPELVHLPAGSLVQPLAAHGGGGFPVVVPVYLDKRQIAKAVAEVTADRMARR